MKNVTMDEWQNIPEAPDLVKPSKKQRNQEYQRYTPVPDSILQATSLEENKVNSIDPMEDGNQAKN